MVAECNLMTTQQVSRRAAVLEVRLRSFKICTPIHGPPLWSSGHSFWLQIQRSRVRSPALPDFMSSSGSGTGSTQPREPREVN